MRKEKYFIIKNKQGRYWGYDLNKIITHDWCWAMSGAVFYRDASEANEQCEKIRNCHEDCDVIEIMIKEIK